MVEQPRRVLCLDIEGGKGGSSRSLFFSVTNLDRTRWQPEVWCRSDSPQRCRYEELGITCHITPDMPKVTTVPRFLANFPQGANFLLNWFRHAGFRSRLLQAANADFDLIHLNHESLWVLARWLKNRTRTPVTCHIRTRLPKNWLARWQARNLARSVDGLVFITENEKQHMSEVAGMALEGPVINNIVAPPDKNRSAERMTPDDGRFLVLSLSNHDPLRGTDRLVEVAAHVKAMGRDDVLFVFAGRKDFRGGTFNRLLGKPKLSLDDEVLMRDAESHCLLLGHVSRPEDLLAECDMLIKLTRESNPWGRDIIEGLAAGMPVLSLGRYDRFVKNGETGVLHDEYNPDAIARSICELADNRETARAIGRKAHDHIMALCNGPDRACDLTNYWDSRL